MKFLIFFLAIASFGYTCFETFADPERAFYLLPSRFWELAAGAILFRLHLKNILLPLQKIKSEIFLLCGLVIVIIGFFFTDRGLFLFPWAIAPVFGTMLAISGVAGTSKGPLYFHRLLESDLIVYIGKISYSLYLWHWPIYTFFRWTIGLDSIGLIALAIILTFLFSVASYRLIEQPFRRSVYIKKQKNSNCLVWCFVDCCFNAPGSWYI
ncbi:MAG: acyltransferase [Desulfarculaceae bacterium]|nr:acyltransferase [Desulfarculaceae bacterium]MCF8118293.1 acyltransferase [Desulfarculaceae bacterium]